MGNKQTGGTESYAPSRVSSSSSQKRRSNSTSVVPTHTSSSDTTTTSTTTTTTIITTLGNPSATKKSSASPLTDERCSSPKMPTVGPPLLTADTAPEPLKSRQGSTPASGVPPSLAHQLRARARSLSFSARRSPVQQPQPQDEFCVPGLSQEGKEELKSLQERTAFDKVEVGKLYEVFAGLSGGGRQPLSKEAFKAGLTKLETCGLRNLSDTPFGERLFSLLDTNHDGSLDLAEFVIGLSLLCKGSVEEKLELSFKAYDIDGNGFISRDELSLMFKSAWISGFRALSVAHGNEELSQDELDEFAEEMASLFAENAFDTLDTNGDGQLSFEEFKQFAMAEPKITATLNGFKKEVSITF